ncbi:MAG: MBOAT family protein [Clostridia bacterium]|nr:MBOAT family protein [Clostridia bacterium]
MLFSSTVFIYLFLPAVLIIYYGLLFKSRTLQNVFLFLVSIFFYAWGEPKLVLLMILSIFINWASGLLVSKYKDKKPIKRIIITVSVILNLSMLFIFKYLNFTSEILFSLFGKSSPIPKIVLPIGISFFTFQAMSYVLDIARGRGEAQKNILNTGLYISFFPQLIAGPIVRYETVANEIKHRKETCEDFFKGFSRFVIGLGKKVLLANSFAVLADKVYAYHALGEISTGFAWLGAISYTLQIFFDFSGYSDMAIGLGKMFGFHFLENFNYPYISKSITEFWRRWHMSLGTWFRDYVYFPLGGSRVKTKKRLVFNLFAVWALTGIWHGANWTFLVWGLMYFVLLTIEKLTKFPEKKSWIFGNIYTLFFVIIGWVIFRSDSLSDAIRFIGYMFGIGNSSANTGLFTGYLTQYSKIFLVGIFCSIPTVKVLAEKIKCTWLKDTVYVLFLSVVFILSISSLASSSYNPFIYFNF